MRFEGNRGEVISRRGDIQPIGRPEGVAYPGTANGLQVQVHRTG